MNIPYKKYSIPLVAVLVILGFVIPHTTHAWGVADLALLLPGYIVSWVVLPVMSLLVYLSGMLLNLSINISVVNMKDSVDAAGINEIWKVIRDVANMGFIFVLIYTAIMTIFGKGDYQKVIKNVVIGALLINFSLFITKAIIDASNLLALFFYNAISPGGISALKGISSSFMDVLGITNLYKGAGTFEGTKLVIIGLGGAVVYLITSFSFLAVAALFIIRFIILMLLMVLSPLMFIGSIIPGISDKAKEWWDALVSQSLFGPVYFMLTWVTLRITQKMFTLGDGSFSGTGGSDGSLATALTGLEKAGTYTANSGSAEILLKFIIIISFMIASLLAAKKIAEKAGGAATKTAFAWAGGATIGLAGRAGRGTIGRAGAAVANSQWAKDNLAEGGISGAKARLAMLAGNKAAKSSFDIRATKLGGQLDAGKVKKGTSFEQDVKDRTKAAQDRVKFVGLGEKAKKAKEDEEKAKKELAEAEKEARNEAKKAHPDIEKSADLKLAEEMEKDARSAASRISISNTATPQEIAAARKKHDDATAEADRLREEHKKAEKELEEKRKVFVESQTAAQRMALSGFAGATNARKAAEERSDAFIKKQGEPFIGKKGAGEAMAEQQIATTDRHPVARPLAWLGNKLAPAFALRGKEREDRVKAIRKEVNKSKEDLEKEKQKEELIKAAKEGAKEGTKKED